MADFGPNKRLALHAIFEELISPHKVYFQPPSSLSLAYPCILYEIDTVKTLYADSIKYKNKIRYIITVIDKDPDSEIPNKIMQLEYSSFDRHFSSDNLHHFVFILYY